MLNEKSGVYSLAHKGGEDDDAYYSASVDVGDECHITLARELSSSECHKVIADHARGQGLSEYLVNGRIRKVC